MKKTLAYLYLGGTLLMPTAYALAQASDGHTDHVHGAPPVADPSSRGAVMVVVGLVFALMIGWFVWSKMKSGAPMGDTTPTATPPTTPPTEVTPPGTELK